MEYEVQAMNIEACGCCPEHRGGILRDINIRW